MFFKAPIISDLFLSSWQHTIEQSVYFLKGFVISGANAKIEPTKSWNAFQCDYYLDDDVLCKRFDNLSRGIFKIKSDIYDGSFIMLHLQCSIRCIWLISKYTSAFLNLLLYNALKISIEKKSIKILFII